jgi:hypothetical protein
MPTSVAYIATQAGSEAAGAFTEGSVSVGAGVIGGVRFQLTASILPFALTLALRSTATGTPTDNLRVFYLTSSAPSAYSGAFLPSQQIRTFVGEFRTRGASITAGQTLTGSLRPGFVSKNCSQVTESGAFNGFLNFTLESSASFAFDVAAETSLTILQNEVVHSERFSVAGREVGERWRIDPRDGFPHPVCEFTEDGERKGLYTIDPDVVGKREARNKGRREKEARLWPRI